MGSVRFRFLLLPLALLLCFYSYAQHISIESFLYTIPELSFKKIETPAGFQSAYEIMIRQALDHDNPKAGYFYQKVYLSHKGFDKPVVFATEGYDCNGNYIYELTKLLDANQIEVEHRFFGASITDSMDYSFLNLKQATRDLHAVNLIFKKFYNRSNWISTGISKGGQTSIYYRYYFPDDVSASVPYVAPFNLSLEDKRIYTFLDSVGSDECREKIKAFQISVLQKRDSIIPILRNYCLEHSIEFNYLSLPEAFEYTVLEYSFSFWQWGHDCNTIPVKDSPVKVLIPHLLKVSDVGFFSDKEIITYASHYYQAATEMGYYGYDISEFDTLIKALPTDQNPLATFAPNKMKTVFDSTLSYNAFNWLKNSGNNFIYLYGASDTWSATAVPPSSFTNSVWFFMPNESHGTARIKNLGAEQKKVLIQTLGNWLRIDINESNIF